MSEENKIENEITNENVEQAPTELEDEAKLQLGYEYFNSSDFGKAIEIFEELYSRLHNTSSPIITRRLTLVLALCYGNLGKVQNEVDCYSRFFEVNNKDSEFEDVENYAPELEIKVKSFIDNFNDVFINYYNMAVDSFNEGQLLKAVSYMDTCWAMNKIVSINNFREIYKAIYLNSFSSDVYLQNKVAVYAICKNERAFVERWLESMSEADYICVLDTGSTDGTYETFVELAEKNPKIIVQQQVFDPWRFDTPRNIAMSLIPKDANILLSTDLDETLEPGWYDDLVSNWKNGEHERANYQYAWSHTASGGNGRVFWYNKVHTRNWIWRYPVHELLYNLRTNSEDYTPESAVALQKMFLHHYPDTSKSRGNYLPLLEQRANEDVNDTYGLIYLAHEYNYRGLYQESIDLYNNIVLNKIDQNDTLMKACSYLFMGDDYLALNNHEKAEECYLKSIESDKTYREGYLNLAQMLLDDGKYERAIYYVKEALKNSHRHFSWLERDTSWTFQPFDILALAYYYFGDKVRSYACAIKAAQLEPADARLQNNVKLIKDSLTDIDWGM